MRRKDILIITAILIVITFGTVFGIYCVLNQDKISQKVDEVAGMVKKDRHSNGWETAIVEKIKYGVPIPVGFTYLEGKKDTGIIIEDNSTKENYMWIPYQEVEFERFQEIVTEDLVKENTKEAKDNIMKYNGFYVGIDEKGYKPTTDVIKELSKEELDELEIYSSYRTDSVESHLITAEELVLIEKMNEGLENKIKLSNFRALTVLGQSVQENQINVEDETKAILAEKGWDERLIGAVKKEIINEEIYYIPIPNGFEYKEGTLETGFKIENTENLLFVWIPVKEPNKVKESLIEKMEASRLIINDTIEKYKTYTDNVNSEEYKELIKSIEKYGGFYISEAELGYDASNIWINKYRDMYSIYGNNELNYVTDGDYYRYGLTYSGAIEKCRELYNNSETVISHLGYGLEYDATMLYLLDYCKDIKSNNSKMFEDSTEIGKYQYYSEHEGGKQSLWEKEFYLNGIYGLAGNLAEITQERNGEEIILRGGSWNTTGNSETLASKSSVKEENINYGEDEQGNRKELGNVGIRAFIHIKTEYVETDLSIIKEQYKKEFINYVDNIKVYQGDEEFYSFNTKINDVYEIQSLNDIIAAINKEIEEETSRTGVEAIVIEGKEIVDKIKIYLKKIINYPEETAYPFTYGEISTECWNIKQNVIQEIKNLYWTYERDLSSDRFYNEKGETITIFEIITNAVDNITNIRNNYRENVYKEEIEEYIAKNYPSIADKLWVKELKEEVREKLYNTEDLGNLRNITKDYREKIANKNSNNIETTNKYFDNIEIGQYVQYIPKSVNNYEVKEEYAGNINKYFNYEHFNKNQIIKQENLKWKIFNINIKENKIDLISENTTEASLCLGLVSGYNNGVFLLNDICKTLYSNEELGAISRSININDINSKLKEDVFEFESYRHNGKVIEYGDTIRCSKNKYYPYLWSIENTKGKIDGEKTNGYLVESEQNELVTQTWCKAEKTIEVPQTFVEKNLEFKDSIYNSLLNGSYWLASRWSGTKQKGDVYYGGGFVISQGSDKANYFNMYEYEYDIFWGLRTINNLLLGGIELYQNDGLSRIFQVEKIRPIVTIQIDKINFDKIYTERGWELKQ